MLRRTLFIEGGTYHVYNRGNGHEPIFCNNGNYEYFLKKYFQYMSMYWDTHAWCLMPNHFHMIVTVRKNSLGEDLLACTQAFANFTNGYAQSFNRQQQRKGSLFMRSFKRKNVSDKDYLKKLVCYVHNNPVKPRIVRYPNEWEFSSYNKLYSADASLFESDPILKLFGSRDEFHRAHVVNGSPGNLEIQYAA